jgi:hypothetical protein
MQAGKTRHLEHESVINDDGMIHLKDDDSRRLNPSVYGMCRSVTTMSNFSSPLSLSIFNDVLTSIIIVVVAIEMKII